MALRENDFLGATVESTICTLNDLGIDIYYIDRDDFEITYIETTIGYYIDFVDGVCDYSGYEDEIED